MPLVAMFFSACVNAAVTINIQESGGDVVATSSGSLDISTLGVPGSAPALSSIIAGSSWNPSFQSIVLVSGGGARDTYTIDSGATTFSTGSLFVGGTNSGSAVGIDSLSSGTNTLIVASGYTSGTPISGSSTFAGQTILSMGLIPGSYTFTWATDSVTINIIASTYTIGGNVTGLTGSVTLQNSGGDDLVVGADGAFTFATAVNDGGAYAVTVSAQPAGQTCTVTNGSGTVAGADVTNVAVACVDNAPLTYSVGGNATGLTGSVTLQNNGADDLVVGADGAFSFATPVNDGGAYAVTVSVQPAGQTCTVTNGSGTIAGADVADVAVDCVDDPVVGPGPGGAAAIPTLPLPGLLLMILGILAAAGVQRRATAN
ncbi:hypothetical protein C0039_00325 [Pseudohalioglobus lutimaris]|uniref:Uncharacterized protein n=1 Tax=Pseudohalioglobus lutimaris TaxID=1737061 RepID=A0A2N5X7Z8_9GAMM|nr:hypothetical protein C0039_00325 [Pseudohalioglobus lutimaris]